MSLQQQAGLVYPNNATSSTNPSPSSHSNGSFGPVFIVLAVIAVISAVGCFVGRLRSRKHHHHEPPNPRTEKREPKHGYHGSFKDGGMGDIESGFGKDLPNEKEHHRNGEMAEGAKVMPRVRFELGGDPKGVVEA